MKKKRRKASFSKIKILLSVLVFTAITMVLGYNCLINILKIYDMVNTRKELETELVNVKEEYKKNLEKEVCLEDSECLANYVREKYFYSKDGEFILRLD